MSTAVAPSGYGRGPGHVAVTAVVVGIGGALLPLVGWVVGLALLWTARTWTRRERWIATLAPIAAGVVGIVVWTLVEAALPARAGASPTPEPLLDGVATAWIAWILVLVGQAAVAVWLLVLGMRRTRSR
ncbi:hypothetical protein GCM10009846_28640 [Agrococcus versicolor]|uniref:Uncharacterized protein n=1 Tax=Agrococcus versicolor TaxID=501482 RepID=A0ABP5MSV1_9MICO